jgi:protein-disulfide isomerase
MYLLKKITYVAILLLVVSNVALYSKFSALEGRVQQNIVEIESAQALELRIKQIVDDSLKERELVKKRYASKQKLAKLEPQHVLARKDSKKLVYGNPEARISLKMYGDIECPFCRKIHKELKKIVDNSQGVINWEYKHFPLSIHNPSAAINAQAIECIAETHDNQKAWIALTQFINGTKGNGRGIDDIPEFVRSFGLNGSMVSNCLKSDAHKLKINQDYAEGRSLNVKRTPAIQIVDTATSKSALTEGYLKAEAILEKIQQLVN